MVNCVKIALAVPSWPPDTAANGIVTYAAYLVPALRRLGHDVYVISANLKYDNSERELDRWSIDITRHASKETLWNRLVSKLSPATGAFNRASSTLAAAISALVRAERIDVLEIEESFGLSFAVSSLNLLPVVVRLHGPWFVNGKFGDPDYGNILNSRREEFEGRGIRYAQTLTSPSANVIDTVKRHYSLSSSIESKVIPNPISSSSQGQRWNLANCCRDSLLFIGRIDKRKGADLILLAFADLATRYPQLRLKLVGPDRGIENNKGELLTYEEFIRANIPESVRSRIQFFGPLRNSDLEAQRTKCFATIVASRYEIMPYSILEAMSLGCPLIATSVGGIPEMITNLHNGLLVPSEDLGAIIRACERLIDDPQLAAALGEQAWLDCRHLYDPERIAQQTATVYADAIHRFKATNLPAD